MFDLTNKRIILTGSDSMIGLSIKKELSNHITYLYRLPHSHFNLENWEITNKAFKDIQGDVLIHLAAYNGNINFNKLYPFDIYYKTAQIGLNVLRAAAENGIQKIISLISSCAYPDLGDQALSENDFWSGAPNKSVSAHGYAKRSIVEFGQQITKQFGIPCVGMVVNTVYGQNDSFDANKTKVIGSLISKFSKAKKEGTNVHLLGKGMSRREFIYCDDVAKNLVRVFQEFDGELINIGSGKDYTIKEVADIIADKIGFEGDIIWGGEPDGQMRKLLDNSRMRSLFGNIEFLPLEQGLERTINWYESQT